METDDLSLKECIFTWTDDKLYMSIHVPDGKYPSAYMIDRLSRTDAIKLRDWLTETLGEG